MIPSFILNSLFDKITALIITHLNKKLKTFLFQKKYRLFDLLLNRTNPTKATYSKLIQQSNPTRKALLKGLSNFFIINNKMPKQLQYHNKRKAPLMTKGLQKVETIKTANQYFSKHMFKKLFNHNLN
jgi:hypothetical protein